MNYTILEGDNKDTLKTIEDCSIDAVVTDPPYGIAFLGKDWDSKKASETTSELVALQNLPSGMKHTSYEDDLEFQLWMRDVFSECYRVLKPGGYLLAFSAARTYHHMAMAAQTAGFEIRDQLMWLYASGFPKAQDIGKALEKKGIDNDFYGWKTALKPAHEPIVMARKPFKGSTLDNVLEHGVGALNIDASRIEWDSKAKTNILRQNALGGEIVGGGIAKYASVGEDADAKHDTQRIQLNEDGRYPSNVIGEVEDYQKYFYCPKVSRNERHQGINNNHPTVKPVELMKYLIKLVTPPNSVVLDPFCGSGSTGMAATELGHTFIGCEQDPNYVEIAKTRIAAWNDTGLPKELFE